MFLSCAHTDAEIDRALEATDGAFAAELLLIRAFEEELCSICTTSA